MTCIRPTKEAECRPLVGNYLSSEVSNQIRRLAKETRTIDIGIDWNGENLNRIYAIHPQKRSCVSIFLRRLSSEQQFH